MTMRIARRISRPAWALLYRSHSFGTSVQLRESSGVASLSRLIALCSESSKYSLSQSRSFQLARQFCSSSSREPAAAGRSSCSFAFSAIPTLTRDISSSSSSGGGSSRDGTQRNRTRAISSSSSRAGSQRTGTSAASSTNSSSASREFRSDNRGSAGNAPRNASVHQQQRLGSGEAGADGQHSARAALPPVPAKACFKVEASYVGSKINVYGLMHRPEFSGHYKKMYKGTVVLGLLPKAVDPMAETTGLPLDPYMVAFSYGSVVFFNTDRDAKDSFLKVCRQEAEDPVPTNKSYTEEYAVTVDPMEQYWSRLEADNVTLQQLDLRNIQVISQVLAQSVALDFYSSHVERSLQTFCSMNLEMQQTRNITKINKQVLLQMVAENNMVMTDIINKLGVHERYDIAWKHVQYGRIWEFLRTELEMDARFKTLDMKLNLIQDNLKYFLEILQNRKSDTLEWIIIILIGAEICLSLYDLAGKGLGA